MSARVATLSHCAVRGAALQKCSGGAQGSMEADMEAHGSLWKPMEADMEACGSMWKPVEADMEASAANLCAAAKGDVRCRRCARRE